MSIDRRRIVIARIVKEYDERHAEFLDAAQVLFFTKGYEKTSVQDIIKAVGVAKGTFYHYFESKVGILDALVKRMYKQSLPSLEAIISNEMLNAIEKFVAFFSHVHQWKENNKALIIATARVMYQDENILLREKMREESLKVAIPMLAQIIQQGSEEGIFDVIHFGETAELIFAIGRVVPEAVVALLLSQQRDSIAIKQVKNQIQVFNLSVTRVLGMPDGAFQLIDTAILDIWLSD